MSSIPIIPNFNDTTPAATTGRKNVKWQADALNPADISVNFQNIGSVNTQTGTSYTLGLVDQGKLTTFSNAAPITVTLDSTVPNDFYAAVEDLGAGSATLTPSSGTINGSANLVMTTGQGGWLFFNGTNWLAVMGGSGGGGLVSPLTTKGDVWGFSTVDARIPIGTNGQWLTADSTQTLGLKWANQPFDLGFQLPGLPPANTLYLTWEFTRTVLFPANFSGSAGKCLTNPTAATVVFTVLKNGSTVGTVTIASSGAFTFATSGGVSVTYNTSDYMTISTPIGADITLADVGWVLAGTR